MRNNKYVTFKNKKKKSKNNQCMLKSWSESNKYYIIFHITYRLVADILTPLSQRLDRKT